MKGVVLIAVTLISGCSGTRLCKSDDHSCAEPGNALRAGLMQRKWGDGVWISPYLLILKIARSWCGVILGLFNVLVVK